MNAVRGRVRGGRIELDGALPEGAEVVVLANGQDESFDLDDDQLTEIEPRMAEADRGEVAGSTLEDDHREAQARRMERQGVDRRRLRRPAP